MRKIIENATIIYKNGSKEICDAISVTKNGVYTGHIKHIHKNRKAFVNHSFIPKDQIQQILFLNEFGASKNIDVKKEYMEEM